MSAPWPPPGACCFPDGTCTQLLETECQATWLGPLTSCTACPPPVQGACCGSDGRCVLTTQAQCRTGDWRINLSCNPNPCPPVPLGACCINAVCTVTLQTQCRGQWLGPDTICDPNPCPGGNGDGGQCIQFADYPHWVGGVLLPPRGIDLAVSGTIACVETDGGLQVVDVSRPDSPERVGQLGTNEGQGLAAYGGMAYLAESTGSGGDLLLINFADPGHPAIAGSVVTNGSATDVATNGSYAYVTTSSQFEVVNVQNPASAYVTGSLATGSAAGVAVQGTTAYITGGLGFDVIDATNPTAPKIVGHMNTPGAGNRVAVADTLAYVADGASGLLVIDIARPANPTILGSVPCLAGDVAVSGGSAYVMDANTGIFIIDVSDPRDPYTRCIVPLPNQGSAIAVSAGLAYATDSAGGFEIADVSSAKCVPVVGHIDMPGSIGGLTCSGTVAYCADSEAGLQVIDISDPQNPQIEGSLSLPSYAAADIAVSGSYAYIAAYGPGALVVADVSNPRSPSIAGTIGLPGEIEHVVVVGTRAYVTGDGGGGLEVIDVTDPKQPRFAGSDPDVSRGDFAVSGSYAYVVDPYQGLLVIDVSHSGDPRTVDRFTLPALGGGVAISGSFAYITASYPASFLVVDISNPLSPRIVGNLPFTWNPAGVAVAGTHAYVGDTGMQVVDVRNPWDPRLVGGSAFISPWGLELALSGRLVCALEHREFAILPSECEAPAGVSSSSVGHALSLGIDPNPAPGAATLRFGLAADDRASISIHDVEGRHVRTLSVGPLKAGPQCLSWDGRDDEGRPVPAGIYLARVSTSRGLYSARVVVVR